MLFGTDASIKEHSSKLFVKSGMTTYKLATHTHTNDESIEINSCIVCNKNITTEIELSYAKLYF